MFARPTELPKFHQRVVNGDLVRRNDSPVKSILKRPSISGSLTKNSEPEQQTKGRSEDYAVANSISNRRTPLSNLPDNHATANPKTPPDYKVWCLSLIILNIIKYHLHFTP